MKTFATVLLFSILLSALATLAVADNIIIKSYCPFPVYFAHDFTAKPCGMGLVAVLQQGQTFAYPVRPNAPLAMKFSKDWVGEAKPGAKLEGSVAINQFEMNYETNYANQGGRHIQYNWSNVDCQGHQGNVGGECPLTPFGMVGERKGCQTYQCKPGDRECKQCYQVSNDKINIGCSLDGEPDLFHLSLCNYNAEGTPGARLRRRRPTGPGDDKAPVNGTTYHVNQPLNSTVSS
ncbi:hypothetical protein FKW77_001235 [Venturia effusa]|uniref:Uncharacterized protein n=1 Tax=Venturia effusa TaxID=50376 RepID=A0A517L2R1_9PEZI|nr:hypothetical protein FKW77_001235 [Venturia effusa]